MMGFGSWDDWSAEDEEFWGPRDADVAELADAPDSKPGGVTPREGSSPSIGTMHP
jgi:hypothetical protein